VLHPAVVVILDVGQVEVRDDQVVRRCRHRDRGPPWTNRSN